MKNLISVIVIFKSLVPTSTALLISRAKCGFLKVASFWPFMLSSAIFCTSPKSR